MLLKRLERVVKLSSGGLAQLTLEASEISLMTRVSS